MKYKLPDNGFARFELFRGKRRAGVWIVPGKTVELEPKDLSELTKLGIRAIAQPEKPRPRLKLGAIEFKPHAGPVFGNQTVFPNAPEKVIVEPVNLEAPRLRLVDSEIISPEPAGSIDSESEASDFATAPAEPIDLDAIDFDDDDIE